MLQVKKQTLLLVVGLVWLAAGINILRIGIEALAVNLSKAGLTILLLVLAVLVLAAFLATFRKIVPRHTKRILGYAQEKKSVFCFFDAKGYLLMVFMMGLGIVLRRQPWMPLEFFAAFYTGLGSALSVSGIRFMKAWWDQR